jgi:hypothetical protein
LNSRKRAQIIAKQVEEESDDHVVLDQKVRKATNVILQSIEKTLVAFLSILTNGLVMRKVIDDPIVKDVIPDMMGLAKDALVEKNLLLGVVHSLFDVKRPNTNVKLVTKHAILTTLVNGGSTSSLRQKTRLLKVHPRNITMVVHHRELM